MLQHQYSPWHQGLAIPRRHLSETRLSGGSGLVCAAPAAAAGARALQAAVGKTRSLQDELAQAQRRPMLGGDVETIGIDDLLRSGRRIERAVQAQDPGEENILRRPREIGAH